MKSICYYAIYSNYELVNNRSFDKLEKNPNIIYIHEYTPNDYNKHYEFIDEKGNTYYFKDDMHIIGDIGCYIYSQRYDWKNDKYIDRYTVTLKFRKLNDFSLFEHQLEFEGGVISFYKEFLKFLKEIKDCGGYETYRKIEALHKTIDDLKCEIFYLKKQIEKLSKEENKA